MYVCERVRCAKVVHMKELVVFVCVCVTSEQM